MKSIVCFLFLLSSLCAGTTAVQATAPQTVPTSSKKVVILPDAKGNTLAWVELQDQVFLAPMSAVGQLDPKNIISITVIKKGSPEYDIAMKSMPAGLTPETICTILLKEGCVLPQAFQTSAKK